MIYRKRNVFKWTPRLFKKSKVILVTVFTVGGLLGFAIGVVSASSNDLPNEPYIQITPDESSMQVDTESTPIVSDLITTDLVESETEPEKIYYDCPLDHDLQDYIRDLCEENGVPMDLVIAQISVESSFRADVISGTDDYGLMQINAFNHEWLSEEYGITDFLDPYQNVYCGITILSQHYNRFQDIDKALMAYNLGAGGAEKMWNEGIYETTYSRKVREAMEVYSK